MAARILRITLAYDGTDFVGWQRQASGISIQGLVEDALSRIEGAPVAVSGAGRTDAGVHAVGQVASATMTTAIDLDSLARALNAILPASIRVLDLEQAPPEFHARFGAREKIYQYRIASGGVLSPFERRYAWHVKDRLDTHAMADAARALEGTHDFSAFQAAGRSTVTSIRSVLRSTVTLDLSLPILPVPHPAGVSRLIVYEIAGQGFLRHMVRNIVGSLVEIGRGRHPPEWLAALLSAQDRRLAGPTAPAHGLFLVRVQY